MSARRTRPTLRSTDPVRVRAALADERALARAGLHDLVSVVQRSRAGWLNPASTNGERLAWALLAVAGVRELTRALDEAWPRFIRDALEVGAPVAEVASVAGLDEALVASMARDLR